MPSSRPIKAPPRSAADALAQAEAAFAAGRLADAETVARRQLLADPGHARANHLLAAIAYSRKEYERALEWANTAVRGAPREALYLHTLARTLRGLGRLDEAIVRLREASALAPGAADIAVSLGAALRERGDLEEAEACYRKVLARHPGSLEALVNLGNVLQEGARAEGALEHYAAALRLQPRYAPALLNQAKAYRALQRFDDALASYRACIAAAGFHEEALMEMGRVLKDTGRLTEAAECFEQVIRVRPRHASAFFHLAEVAVDAGQFEDAERLHRESVRLAPDDPMALNQLAIVLRLRNQVEEALGLARKAVELNPAFPEARVNVADLLASRGEAAESERVFLRLIEDSRMIMLGYSNFLMNSNYVGVPPETLLERHRGFEERYAAGLLGAGLENRPRPPRAGDRLRVGYVSPDLRRHSVAFFMEPVLERYDRARFEVTCYFNSAAPDAVSERLQKLVDRWVPVHALSDEALAQRVRDDGIDILVDLAGHTSGIRLLAFARKPAPVQACWLGYPTTSGLAAMDFRITDWAVDPEGYEAFNVERPVRLPGSYFCYRPPADAPPVAPPPSVARGAVTFGSFNNFTKASPAVIALWAEILRALPGSRLLLKAPSLADAGVRAAAVERFAAAGVAGERLLLRGWEQALGSSLALYGEVDVGLDTYPYNGATTTCEALWMGVPVVSLSGATHASRMGRSILTTVGLAELVAETPEQYVARALALAHDVERRAALRAGMRARMSASALMDERGFTAALEAAYLEMWRQRDGAAA